MNLSGTEFGVLGLLALIIFGGSLKLARPKKDTPRSVEPKLETDSKASFQQSNTVYKGKSDVV